MFSHLFYVSLLLKTTQMGKLSHVFEITTYPIQYLSADILCQHIKFEFLNWGALQLLTQFIISINVVFVSEYILGIHPNMICGSSAPGDASCVANAFCNQTHFCVCRIGYKATKTSCKYILDLYIFHSITGN